MRHFALVWGFFEVLAVLLSGCALCLQSAGAIAQPLWLVLFPFSLVGAVRSVWTCVSFSMATTLIMRHRADLQTVPMWAPRQQRRRRVRK